MRITRRPAWPVVFFLASGLATPQGRRMYATHDRNLAVAARFQQRAPEGETEPRLQGRGHPLEELSAEIAHWRRIRRPAGAEAMRAFEQAYAEQTRGWVARWPEEELAWRERLRALTEIPAEPAEVATALDGAARAIGKRSDLRFPEDTRFYMARAAVRHGVRLDDVPGWTSEAVRNTEESRPAGNVPLTIAYRRERLSEARWRAAEILAELAYRREDAASLTAEVVRLTVESAVPVAGPADRIAVAERARRRAAVFLWRARLAQLRGRRKEALERYRQALAARPTAPGGPEWPENLVLVEEAKRYGVPAAGGGSPIPPALSAGPHWLPTVQRLAGFALDGRPAVALVWDGKDPALARAVERLERRGKVRILSFAGAEAAWVRRFNPLYTAAQIWIVDSEGVVRLVGRFQPGGDGWEDAVTGAAERIGRSPGR